MRRSGNRIERAACRRSRRSDFREPLAVGVKNDAQSRRRSGPVSTPATNRQWRLSERPIGMVETRHFSYREEPAPEPRPGEVLVRTLYVSFDPAMRAFLHDRPSYVPPQPIGEVMRAGAI